jgi:hypothetical protein
MSRGTGQARTHSRLIFFADILLLPVQRPSSSSAGYHPMKNALETILRGLSYPGEAVILP